MAPKGPSKAPSHGRVALHSASGSNRAGWALCLLWGLASPEDALE